MLLILLCLLLLSHFLPLPFRQHCHPRNKPGCCVADFHRFFCQLSSAGDYATDGSDLRYNGWSGPGLHPLLQCFVPFCDLIRCTDRLPFGWFRLSFPWNCSSSLLHQTRMLLRLLPRLLRITDFPCGHRHSL